MTVRNITEVFDDYLTIIGSDGTGSVYSEEEQRFYNLILARTIRDKTILNRKIKRLEPINVDHLLVVVY